MKKWMCFSVVLMCLFLAGCSKTTIECGVDNDFNAFVKMNIQADLSQLDEEDSAIVLNSLKDLAAYYESEDGYVVSFETEPAVNLQVDYVKQADSFEGACLLLEEILTTRKITPFTTLEFTYGGGEQEKGFALQGTIDADKIIATAGIEDFNKELREFYQQAIAQSGAELRVVLPATEVVSSSAEVSLENGLTVMTQEIPLDAQTVMELSTRASLVDGRVSDVTIGEQIADIEAEYAEAQKQIRIVAAVPVALALVGILIRGGMKKR